MTGQIMVLTGDGKGKTTSALGTILRALGFGLYVGIIFFDKGGEPYYERKILEELSKTHQLDVEYTGLNRRNSDGTFRFTITDDDIKEAKRGLDIFKEWITFNS